MAAREILASTQASHPRGSWPAEEQAQAFRDAGIPATVVMDLDSDQLLVVTEDGKR